MPSHLVPPIKARIIRQASCAFQNRAAHYPRAWIRPFDRATKILKCIAGALKALETFFIRAISTACLSSCFTIRLTLAQAMAEDRKSTRLNSTHTFISFLPFFFVFNDTATTEIYPLSLHDALPIFHSCDFDGVLVKLFYNTPDLGAGYGRHNNYAMHLQQRTYGQIHSILKPGGVSVNAMNADKNSGVTVPTEEFLESLGFKIELYSPGGNSYDDLVVVRKPLSVA